MDNTGRQAKTVLSVMMFMFLGKFAGLVREILFGYRYGTGSVEAEAFGYAFQIPGAFLDVFVVSALTASFIPVFSGIMEKNGREAAFRMANTFITLVFTVTAAATVLLLAAAPFVIRVFLTFTEGGAFTGEVYALAAPLLRVMLPMIVLTGAAFSVTGILQAMEEFNAPAAMSLASNLLIIVYLLFFIRQFGIFGLAVTFLIGWGTQILIQLPALRKKGFRFKPRLDFRDPGIKAGLKDIGRLMLPVMVGAWAFPINLLVNTAVAGRVVGVAAIRYANTIYAVITGILVLSVTNVMFTRFSKLNASEKKDELGESITLTSRSVLFFLLPLSAALFVLAGPLIYIIYERGEFTAHSTYITGTALRFFALGMAGFGLYNILSRGCYAVRDGRTPLIASLAAIAVNAVLSVSLIDRMGTGGPALASSVSITFAGIILLVSLARKKIFRAERGLFADLLKMLLLAVTMGLIVYTANSYFTGIFDENKFTAALSAALAGLLGIAWYMLGARLLRVKEMETIKGILRKNTNSASVNGLNVLMVTMSLNIGGAETHIIELCRALKKDGVNVFAASAGGKYVPELTGDGIPHFTAPLNRKNLRSIFSSYFTLKRVVRENNIGIVHAHARIPAFICGFLCKRLKVRFVTTAHGMYKTGFPYSFLTNWGQAVLAVSEDVKEYLVRNYGYNSERIIMTVNGVDSGKFSPETDGSPLIRELGLDPDKKRIVSVCRLDSHIDPDRTGVTRGGALLAVLGLCEAAPSLEAARPKEFEIIIVGDGDSFAQVKSAADKANKAAGREMVALTGARTDVRHFLGANFAFLFMNVSRAAFEAMSSACPVILADSDGYIGLLTPDKYEMAAQSNFCCRGGGHPRTTPELLLKDILKAAALEPSELAKIGSYGREYVKERYSVKKMADDTQKLYGLVSRKVKKYDAVLSGYYGTGNSGDEMILTTITKSISEEVRGAGIAVLCRRKPRETAARLGLKTAYAFNIPAIYRLLKQTNLFVSGGGTLITDITSTKSLIYYLFVIKMAKFCGCATMIYASGIGPFKNEKNRRRAAKVLRNVDLITLRDDISMDEIKKMAIPELKPVVTADPVFGLPAECAPQGPLLRELGLENKRFFIVSVRSWKTLPEDFAATLAGFTDYMREKHGLLALFLPMMPSEDLAVSRKVIAASKHGGFLPERVLGIEEILSLCACAEFTAAMRLHAIIYSAKMGTPVIGLSYDPKVQAILDIFGSGHCVKVEEVTDEALRGFAEDVISRRGAVSARLLSVSGELADKSRVTAKLAGEIINRREVCTAPEK